MEFVASQRAGRWAIALFLGLILLSFVVRGIEAAEANTNASAFDQRSYLGLGLNIREGRDMSDGKRHPLLSALLATIAEREWSYYTKAKFMNVGLGALVLLMVYELGRRWFSPTVGAVTAGLLSLNPPFLHVSAHVMAEPLLILLTLGSWYLMVRTLATREPARWRYAALAGFVTGLAYLAKGTALQMVPAFGLVAVVLNWRYWWRRRWLWAFGAAWLVAWLPLFVFNLHEYSNPLYNYNYKHEIFLDSPTERHFADISEAPTLQTYLATHTVPEMVDRMIYGVQEVTRILFAALAPVYPDGWRNTTTLVWVVAWLALLVFLFTRRRLLAERLGDRGPAYPLLALMILFSLIPLGWFVQASNVGPRFIVVFHPMVWVLTLGAVGIVVTDWRGRAQPRLEQALAAIQRWSGPLAMSALVVWAGVTAWQAIPGLSRHPVAIDREANRRGQDVLEWLSEGTPYGTRVLWGPSYTLPNWIFERTLSLKDVPSKAESWEDVQDFAAEKELAYAIVDWEMVSRREEAFARYFGVEYPWVRMTELPTDWALALAYDGLPANWLVFRMLNVVPPAHPTAVVLEDRIELRGYELHPAAVAPGETAYLTLYWRALEDVGENYSIFVHLVGPEGQMVAQSDHWPLDGLYPTGVWRQGQQIGDRHALTLPASVPAGPYQLLVGMYRLDTMERLLARQADGSTVPDGRVRLDTALTVIDRVSANQNKR